MLLEQQPQHLQHVACALGPLVEKQGAVLRQRHPSRHRDLAAGDQVVLGEGWGGVRKGLVVTKAVWRPADPSTLSSARADGLWYTLPNLAVQQDG